MRHYFLYNSSLGVTVGLIVVSQVLLYYGVKWAVSQMDPLHKKKQQSSAQAKAIFERMGVCHSAYRIIIIGNDLC